jgi:hypothetical protein
MKLVNLIQACFLITLWVLSPIPAYARVSVWAVGDGVRVNPQTGRLIEERLDIQKDYPTGNYRQKNSAWDGAGRVVLLQSARNEFVAFQLILEAFFSVSGIDVQISPLAGPGKIEGRNLQIFKAWYTQVRRASTGYEMLSLGPAWYPDALMPKRSSGLRSGFPFSIPDIHNNIPNQTNHAVWIDVYVPRDAAPGHYRGTAAVTWHGGKTSIDIDLEVWPFTLPDRLSVRGDIYNGSLRRMPLDEELKYYQLAMQHRFVPGVYAYRPGLKIDGTRVTLDWTEYDARVSKYLDGSAFTDKHGYWGPGYGEPIPHILLPFDCERGDNRARAWPMAQPAGGPTPEFEAVWKETARQIKAHFERDPNWRKVRKIAFLDGLDESYNEAAYAKMRYYGRLLDEALGDDWFQFRIDGGYSREAIESMKNEVDLWVCHTVDYDIDLMPELRKQGMESWFYGPMVYEQRKNSGCGSNTFLDLDLLTVRAPGWVAWKYRSGWIEWEFDWNAHAAWYEAENFKEEHRIYQGSGQLIYRGEVMAYDQPIPSIRLKAQRRGLQDYEYFKLLADRRGETEADRIVNGVVFGRPFGEKAMGVTNLWKNNPDAWDEARREAARLIAAR